MVTYEGQSPSEIRTGDQVTDSLGREFTAVGEAAIVAGDYSISAMYGGEIRYLTLDIDSKVTISYDESVWNEDV